MRLTAYTDYNLRVLVYLALNRDGSSTIREISERYGISKNHLMKVVRELSRRSYVIAIRGKNGGLRLNVPPAEINIGRLVREMENDLALVECLGENNQCIIKPACQLQSILTEALEAFFAALDAYTLEDVLNDDKKAELTQILQLD